MKSLKQTDFIEGWSSRSLLGFPNPWKSMRKSLRQQKLNKLRRKMR